MFLFTSVFAQVKKEEKTPHKASVLQTKVTCQFQDISIEDVLKSLQTKYKVKFTYLNDEMHLSKRVSLYMVQQPLEKVLDNLFKGQSISYQEIGSQILLRKSAIVPPDTSKQQTEKKAKPAARTPKQDSISNALNYGKKLKRPHEGSGFFSFRKSKNSLHKAYEIPPTADSTTLAKDSIEKKKREAKLKTKITRKDLEDIPKWSIGLFYAPCITYRSLNGKDKEIEERNTIEKRSTGNAWGLSFDYKLSKGFYARTGLMVMKFKEKGNYTLPKQYLPPPHKRGDEFSTDTSISYTNHYNYFAIPLLIGYTLGDPWFVSVNTGLAPTFSLGNKTDYPSKDLAPASYPPDYVPNPEAKPAPSPVPRGAGGPLFYYKEKLDLRKRKYTNLGWLFLLNVEVGYRIKDHFAVSLSPTFRKFITSIQTKDDKATEKPYAYGVAFSLYYTF